MDTLLQMLDSTADGAFVINQAQQIIYWNQAAQEMLGYTADEATTRNCYDLTQGQTENGEPKCQPLCAVSMAARHGQRVTSFDTCIQAKSGNFHWVNMSTFTVPANEDGQSYYIVHLFRDITQNKQNEAFINKVLNFTSTWQEQTATPSPPTPAPEPVGQDLTDRENEVLALLVKGHSTQEIAQSLSISPATTRNHIQNILHKLRVHSRLEAVTYALKHGLVEQP